MTPDQFRDILYEKDDQGIVTLTFNTPKRKNALSPLSFYEIYCALGHFQEDDSAHAMILTGAKSPDSTDPTREAYSSGGYFSPTALEGVPKEILDDIDQSDIAQKRTTMRMYECDKPILAAINGLTIGGAFTLTLAGADQVFLSEHAWIQLPFSKLGISTELGSSFLLPRLLGFQKAKEIVFYAGRIDAAEAVRLNLANKVLPHDELMAYTRERALEVSPPRGAALAIREMKKLLHAPYIETMSQALDLENQALHTLFKSDDFKEAMIARAQRRDPAFKGS